MRKIKFTLLLIIGLIFFSCQSKFDLKSDKHLTEIFSNNELVEIEKMINFVDNRVVELTGSKDINEAYHQLFDKINKAMQDSLSFLVPFEEEEKYKFLQSLDTTVFSEFWYMGNHIRKAVYKDSIYQDLDNYRYLDLRHSGRYSDYLDKIGESDAYYQSVKQTLDFAIGLAPSIVASFLKTHNEFDFTIPKNRLWASVFILAIEEPHDKKMERYLKLKDIKQ